MKKESKQSSVEINERAFSTSTNHVMNHSLDNFPHTHLSTAKKSIMAATCKCYSSHQIYEHKCHLLAFTAKNSNF